MKLYLGENMRKLRLAKDLTQEALAEELGVSPQTISRWEGGSSYPDVELLPEIAGYFDVSVDALIGADTVRQKEHLKAGIAALWREPDLEVRIEMARKLCREHPQSADAWIQLFHALAWRPSEEDPKTMKPSAIHYAEAKKTAEKIFSLSRDNHVDFDSTVRCLVELAPEDEVEELLDKYATAYDITRGMLLEHRYLNREDWPRFEARRQRNLLLDLQWWMQSRFRKRHGDPPEVDAWAMTALLRFLNLLTGYEGDALIDPTPDLWCDDKLWLAEILANAQAASGRKEEAYRTLGEALDLLGRFTTVESGTVLTYRCPVLDAERKKIVGPSSEPPQGTYSIPLFQAVPVNARDEACGEPETLTIGLVFTEPGWRGMEGLDAIRDEAEFQKLAERAKKLIASGEKKGADPHE